MSDRRSITSAINGARSKGPRTPQGKARSSRNREKHAMYSDALILGNESMEEFLSLRSELHENFSPADRVQAGLVDTMAVAMWRRRRVQRPQDEAMQQALENPALAESAAISLGRYCAYEARQVRIFDVAFSSLRRLQALSDNKKSQVRT